MAWLERLMQGIVVRYHNENSLSNQIRLSKMFTHAACLRLVAIPTQTKFVEVAKPAKAPTAHKVQGQLREL